ncbi:proline-rich receptor-like protein kinase PERK2 [Gossypium raimondii]|uniref:proline-rich receptor-like protein kinase PERK2 n=1 Tax=Gossypium raimondii TaxID=29730 RepID=UPI00063AF429|nr:proline-rich receptor-like protein kinase PERK2 [Gossypium raimondii]
MGGRGRRKQGIGSAAYNGGEPARQDLTIPDHARLASTPGCTPSSHDPSNVSGLDQKPARPQSPRPLFRVTLSFQPLPPGFVAPSRPAPTPRLLPLFPEREVEPLGQRSPTLGPPPSIPGTSQFLASRDDNVEK